MRDVLFDLAVQFPPAGPWGTFSLIPPVSTEEVFGAVSVMGPRSIAALEDAAASLSGLEPPGDLVPGHEQLRDFVDESLQLQRLVVSSAAAGDGDAMRAAIDSTVDAYCSAVAGVGSELVAASSPYFGSSTVPAGPAACLS